MTKINIFRLTRQIDPASGVIDVMTEIRCDDAQ